MHKLSIITPSYNQGTYLGETISSVVQQGYPNLEYIIMDGGSTDESLDIIKMHEKDISVWISEPDNGQSHAFNKGLSKSSGDIIGWLNSDDVYYPGALKKVVQVFNEHPEVDVVFGNVNFIDENGKVLHRTKEITLDLNTYVFTERCYHANAAGFFRKHCFEKYGLLNEKLVYSMDYELYLRFAFNHCVFFQLNDVLAAYRLHAHSKTYTRFDTMKAECKASAETYKKYLKIHPAFYLPLKYYYKMHRIIKKLFSRSYSVQQTIQGITFRSQYHP